MDYSKDLKQYYFPPPIGAYADEHPTIMALHQYAHEMGYTLRGKHHEIYLGDPRRVAPEKLRTVIRQPIEKRL